MTNHQFSTESSAAANRRSTLSKTVVFIAAAAMAAPAAAFCPITSIAPTSSASSLGITACSPVRGLLHGAARLSMREISPEDQPTTFVKTPGGLAEVGSLNAKRDFIVDAHMMASYPERIPSGPIGTMSLVGAGPGDPDLLTMAAHKELAAADLVIADRLVSQEILSLVQCELRVAQKHPGCAAQAQREIYRWCFEALMHGKRVVRLKIGDPFVFGRGGEEVVEFRRFGVEPKVIPGISSALAGPMAAMIPVTHRGIANKVTFCTGMDRNENVPDVPVYDPEQTVVYLMAVGRLQELTASMIERGYPADTPVGICERATTPQQRDITGRLSDIAELAKAAKVRAPAIVVVGEVVGVLGRELEGGEDMAGSHAVEWLIDNGLLKLPAVAEKETRWVSPLWGQPHLTKDERRERWEV